MIANTQPYPEYNLLLPSECIDVADALGLGWVFRGQPDADWEIASALEREVKRFKNASPEEFEAHALQQIKFSASYPDCLQMAGSDDFSWLSFLQHHGCKTRLVDFTESFYVALFFALRDLPTECGEDTGQDAVIWAIKKSRLDTGVEVLAQKHNWDGTADELARRFINNAIELHWRYEESTDAALAVVACRPARLNQRLIAQQGLFLAPLNLKRSFMENLSACLGLQEEHAGAKQYGTSDELKAAEPGLSVLKIVIPTSEHRKLLFHLKRMNISEATLFPGLDGFARSLNYYAVGMELAP